MRCVIAGAPNKVIAFRLGITERTVKAHRAQVMEKMDARSLAELVRLVGRLGVEPDPGHSPPGTSLSSGSVSRSSDAAYRDGDGLEHRPRHRQRRPRH
jgi:hypothetical protein